MTTYTFQLDKRTRNLDAKFPLDERVKLLEKPHKAIIYRAGHFHGWGGLTTDDVYYVSTESRELRHNQVEITWGGSPMADKSCLDVRVERHPLLNMSKLGLVLNGLYAAGLSTLLIKDIEDGRMVVPSLLYVGGILTLQTIANLLEAGPGSSKAWRNYQRYLKNISNR